MTTIRDEEDQRAEILARYAAGVSQRELGDIYGVHQATISYHVNR